MSFHKKKQDSQSDAQKQLEQRRNRFTNNESTPTITKSVLCNF